MSDSKKKKNEKAYESSSQQLTSLLPQGGRGGLISQASSQPYHQTGSRLGLDKLAAEKKRQYRRPADETPSHPGGVNREAQHRARARSKRPWEATQDRKRRPEDDYYRSRRDDRNRSSSSSSRRGDDYRRREDGSSSRRNDYYDGCRRDDRRRDDRFHRDMPPPARSSAVTPSTLASSRQTYNPSERTRMDSLDAPTPMRHMGPPPARPINPSGTKKRAKAP